MEIQAQVLPKLSKSIGIALIFKYTPLKKKCVI